MWVRKCFADEEKAIQSPIPTEIFSNEEFIPPAQSSQQQRWEARMGEMAEQCAKKLGISRRRFLQGTGGMAVAMLTYNEVFGKTYEVEPIEALDPAAYAEKWPKTEFIFDNQTHHVDVESRWFEASDAGRQAADFLRNFRPQVNSTAERLALLNQAHYIKELFMDSDTMMAIISGVPTAEWRENILPPDKMVKTRDEINQMAGKTQRMLSHGLLRPNMGKSELEEMERQVKTLKINSWKMYPGSMIGDGAYWLDDEKETYPFWEKSKKLGVKNICIHKGLPLGLFNEEHCHPKDVEKAAKDFPGLNFIIYHSGWNPTAGGGRRREGAQTGPQYIPWCSELIELVKRNGLKNVYFEVGSTWNGLSGGFGGNDQPAMHFLGQVMNLPGGEDRIIWGTDSIWGGSPQSQIERLRRFQISDEVAEKYGYKKLTPEIKAKIFGLNAARLYSIDVNAKRKAIQTDKIAAMKDEYMDAPRPSNTQFGWVWRTRGRRA
ncbi:MAG TPA: amidohydrolase family protein [Blastocatellia bacterium]|nr:amidohydrolase family protein [Blastocatellia bacterium]